MRPNETKATWQRLWNKRMTLKAQETVLADALVVHRLGSGTRFALRSADPKEDLHYLRLKLKKVEQRIRARSQMNQEARKFFTLKKLKEDRLT